MRLARYLQFIERNQTGAIHYYRNYLQVAPNDVATRVNLAAL